MKKWLLPVFLAAWLTLPLAGQTAAQTTSGRVAYHYSTIPSPEELGRAFGIPSTQIRVTISGPDVWVELPRELTASELAVLDELIQGYGRGRRQ